MNFVPLEMRPATTNEEVAIILAPTTTVNANDAPAIVATTPVTNANPLSNMPAITDPTPVANASPLSNPSPTITDLTPVANANPLSNTPATVE